MSRAYFDDLAPELILLLSPLLSTGSLNALASTCHRIHQVLQPELDARITPVKSRQLLLWASAASKPRVVAKLLSPPYSLHPDLSVGYCSQTPLHVAAIGGNIEVARMLLDSGASTEAQQDDAVHQPLHLAVMHKHLDMVRLLLDHGAPIDTTFGSDGVMQTAFQYACWAGDLDTVKLLLEGGAGLERPQGHFGTALGFAVQARRLDIVRFLLENGADATVSMSLYVLLVDGPPLPHESSLLYSAMGLRGPASDRYPLRLKDGEPAKWAGLPLTAEKKELMALLLAYGASKEMAMETILKYLAALAEVAEHTEEEFLEVIAEMLLEAEDAIPDVLRGVPLKNDM